MLNQATTTKKATMTGYAGMIREDLAKMGRLGVDPRHIEAFMRVEHSTLDGLSRQQFRTEVRMCAEMVDADPGLAERIAESYAL